MGIAAYNRGTKLMRDQITANLPDHHDNLFRDINECRTGTTKLFQDTVIRIDERGKFWLMDRPEEGWASYAKPYDSLHQIVSEYAVHLVGLSRDAHSQVIPVIAL